MNKGTILVVEDELLSLEMMSVVLTGEGYQVLLANSGELALASMAAQPPELILLDIRMPGMDGFEVLRRLKALQETRDIPVIILSAITETDQRVEGLQLGAVDFISKPFQREELLAKVQTHIDLSRSHVRLEKQAADLVLANQALTLAKETAETANIQMLQSEKMASIGQLAAGVAHELNNPIGFVSSNIRTLESYLNDIFAIVAAYEKVEETLGDDTPQLDVVRDLKRQKDFDYLKTDVTQLMAESREGLSRVAKIVHDLKDFAHISEATWQWADLHQGLDSTLNIIWSELKYKCTVIKDYGDLPPVWCIATQLNQVFMNLLVNAGHAIPQKGEITIRTGREGDEVFVAVADTGAGIAPEHLSRIFEPFFTTKPVGKGTGLGLSVAYGIVEKHQGRIEVHSTVGQGSVFRVVLPVEPKINGGDRGG